MRAAIFYATREGHTERIAEHIARNLGANGIEVALWNVQIEHRAIPWSHYDRVFVAASVHAGHHEPEMIAFVKAHRSELERLSAAFLSVTLSSAGAEDVHALPEQRERAADDAQRMIDVFAQETGWRPAHVLAVAGALPYRRYNFVIRLIMKRIARKAGGPTDTSHDYEFTDWLAIDRLVMKLIGHSAPVAGA